MKVEEHLTVDQCLKLYEEEGIVGLVERVKEISFKLGIREALIRVGRESKRMDGTTYIVPDYKKYRQALKDEGIE